MDYDRDTLVEMLVSLGRHEEATRAVTELPERVDPAEQADLLKRLGIAPAELVGSLDVLGGLDAPDAETPPAGAASGTSAEDPT